MKKVLFCLLLACSFIAEGQVYNNEWIDYSKVYYKFKLRNSGVYRISRSVLATVGLGNVPAEQFQLWRDGVEVPIFTSVASGSLGGSDYIEFWGERINGKPDKALYRKPEYQLNDYYSLISDSAVYFLTVNPAGGNSRLTTTPNETAGNTLPKEEYFMHTVGFYPNRLNAGLAGYPIGGTMYSSSYDIGEGYTSNDIDSGKHYSHPFNNLSVYPNGPNAKLKTSVSGNSNHDRTYSIVIADDTVLTNRLISFDYSTDPIVFPLSKILSNSVSIKVVNFKGKMVIHKHELTYPRTFDFGSAKTFEFVLPSSSTKRYLEIPKFGFGTVAPVLYDLTNGRRYVGDISANPKVKFVIQPATEARYVLVNEENLSINYVSALQQRFFVNYADISNQGDFLIISNPLLIDGANGLNPVEEYRAYRSSAAGGGYNAKVCLVEELTDQFAFGINKHPLGIRNFILYARKRFTTAPKHVFLLGKGVDYINQKNNETNANINRLNLVPTFGSPASDVLLAADPGTSVGKVSIGRISVINAQEVKDYLDKVKEFEAAQTLSSPDAKDKLWMKNVLHIIGVSEPKLQSTLESSMSALNMIISDTLYGGKVTTLSKQTGSSVEQIQSEVLQNLFTEGMSLMTYFGHSSSGTLSFNLDNPESYNNKGKYPLFIAMGCDVGNIFGFNTNRYTLKQTLSESYVLAQGKGTIGFIASTYLGIVNSLHAWSQNLYNTLSKTDYGRSIGDIINISAARMQSQSIENFFYRCTMEQMTYHGDPAIKLNTHAKPDYLINDQLVTTTPTFVSISETSFKVKAKFVNIGKAVDKAIAIEVKREYPNQTSQVILDTVIVVRLEEDLTLKIPIDPQRDKGLNKLTITIDADNAVDELFESNNSITKEVFIYEEEARPIYPYNFAIVNDPNVTLTASTADPLSPLRNYKFQIDTTELFDSPLDSTIVSSKGGVLAFQPKRIILKDSTVYYWRVAHVPTSGEYHWNTASFIYMKGDEVGFNQSHLYQHLKSEPEKMYLDSFSRKWEFGLVPNELFVTNTMYPTGGSTDADFSVRLNADYWMQSACVGRSLIFNVFDANTLKPWKNVDDQGRNLYLSGSGAANCKASTHYHFEFSYLTSGSRKMAMNFMDSIPDGSYVVVRSMDYSNPNSYSKTWRSDTSLFGTNNSLYHSLLNAGFATIDSIDRPRAWILIYRKNKNSFIPKYAYTQGIYDRVNITANPYSAGHNATLLSPIFGPAKAWKSLEWAGNPQINLTNTSLKVIGIKKDNSIDTLFTNIGIDKVETDISSIDVSRYPYLRMYMKTNDTLKRTSTDTTKFTPYQLKFWRLIYEPAPEGAVAPNIEFIMQDTLDPGEDINFKMVYKNVSKIPFDSLNIRMVIIDANNVRHVLPVVKQKPLSEFDTLFIKYSINSKLFPGSNTLYVEVNPDNDQPEQFYFNNFIYYNFYVNQDLSSPILDVTFDNVHILNGDIVSSKPKIVIKMTDESSKLLLNDSSLITVKVKYPDKSERTFAQNSDTLKFISAVSGSDNTATIEFNPFFTEDGDYELIVYGEDKSGNKAGNTEYRILFKVINKPMISNLLNYPNPFTTSTAFVFTVTGNEVPTNMKIQILTITGKIVREITKQELEALSPIRIGRNITEFKWDGTDQYGQKLANGVYLYRVVTFLNGKSLDKYRSESDNTDRYFNKGYGKMYLMR